MLKFILKKLALMIPMLLLISIIVFFGLQATGVDPINFMVSPETLSANAGNIDALRESLGLNDPLIVQYFRWLGNCLTGDLGYSFSEYPYRRHHRCPSALYSGTGRLFVDSFGDYRHRYRYRLCYPSKRHRRLRRPRFCRSGPGGSAISGRYYPDSGVLH